MFKHSFLKSSLLIGLVCTLVSSSAFADRRNIHRRACNAVPTWEQLKNALDASGATTPGVNGGFNLNMWGVIVNRDGYVCTVAFTGEDRGDQWPGSRIIAAAKAYMANAYSLPGLALSTANLYASGQPGGSLWGLQFSNPINTPVVYNDRRHPERYGQPNDPMRFKKIGGQIVFGGGFALYNEEGQIVGGVGVSGDTSCKDHNFGWRVREALGFDYVPGGVSGDPARPDNIIYDMGAASQGNITSPSGFGHTDCGLGESAIAPTLPATSRVAAEE